MINLQTPQFWYQPAGWRARLLAPLGCLYGFATRQRLQKASTTPSQPPVICIGNLTAGGGGKTPSAIALHQLLGRSDVHFLSRGHGGRSVGPIMVNPAQHKAHDVGDEPLLLAQHAPCWVARDRQAGHASASASGAKLIIMDDGLQNPSLTPSLRLLAVKGDTGFGNGHIIPAGPLREDLQDGLKRIDGIICIGAPTHPSLRQLPAETPIFQGHYEPDADAIAPLKNKSCIAFAGLARPEGFFTMLEAHGVTLADRVTFADHQPISDQGWQRLVTRAEQQQAQLVTTEKDAMRLKPTQREHVVVVPITLQWQNPSALAGFVNERLAQSAQETADVS